MLLLTRLEQSLLGSVQAQTIGSRSSLICPYLQNSSDFSNDAVRRDLALVRRLRKRRSMKVKTGTEGGREEGVEARHTD